MTEENETLVIEFVLVGFTNYAGPQVLLFMVFLGIYIITMVGNIGLIVLIWMNSHLRTPMYFFLGDLALADACISTTVSPKMLVNFITQNKMISLPECMVQFYFFSFSATTECFLLAAMAYDRYVAICNPLLYPVVMTNGLCSQLSVFSLVAGLLHSMFHVALLFRLSFCHSNKIHHFFCDIMPLYKISCIDPSINILMVFIFSGSIQVFTILTIAISYACILFAILKKKSQKGRRKAFSTCGAHLFSVSLFFGSLLFMYVRPRSLQTDDQDMMDSLFYTIVIPMLNPFIYSLRNKEVIKALRTVLKQKILPK
ncbi:olfactory receptor 5AC1-like [Dromiciops gliroides]|uniref:olfactory receptor 5AC1-like n=1 Tax=Dromiciops gliroides TaxID=33562 RepID=UPI001CC57740|nr:olfactory receptor 5AC1-like [Dromiciops gliroides]